MTRNIPQSDELIGGLKDPVDPYFAFGLIGSQLFVALCVIGSLYFFEIENSILQVGLWVGAEVCALTVLILLAMWREKKQAKKSDSLRPVE
ncbi:MAG: hypothetical protein H6815_08830 [Phycisphaeraceae bacterium]|nr:hypothetical protein [Phycisphaerales bacterium]MCB9860547.1 hypothetical protein [Phycisphaeraceae bacterium]